MSLFELLLLEHLSELVLNFSPRLQLRPLLQSHGFEMELKIYDSTRTFGCKVRDYCNWNREPTLQNSSEDSR